MSSADSWGSSCKLGGVAIDVLVELEVGEGRLLGTGEGIPVS